MVGYLGMQGPAALADETPSIAELQDLAFESYANREFATTIDLLNQIIPQDASNSQWYEMRATVQVDNKSFDQALKDYNKSIELTGRGCTHQSTAAARCSLLLMLWRSTRARFLIMHMRVAPLLALPA